MTTQTHSTTEYKQFFAVFNSFQKIGNTTTRECIISNFTNGRTESLKDLSSTEYKLLIQELTAKTNHFNQERLISDTRQKRKIIALFCQMGYRVGDKADINRINAWCISHGHLKKRLNYYSGADLNKLVTQAELVYQSFIKSL